MDAECLGRKLLLTLSGDPRRAPEKQTVGTLTASHKMLTLHALSSSLNAGTAKRGCLGRGEAFECPPAVCPPKRPRPCAHYRILEQLSEFQGILGVTPLKALTSLSKEVRPFFLGDDRIWSFHSVSSPSDYSIWRS